MNFLLLALHYSPEKSFKQQLSLCLKHMWTVKGYLEWSMMGSPWISNIISVQHNRLIRVGLCKTVVTEKQMAQSNRSSSKRMCLKAVQERMFWSNLTTFIISSKAILKDVPRNSHPKVMCKILWCIHIFTFYIIM